MADEANTPPPDAQTTTSTETPPPAGAPPTDRTFSQADVDRIVNERLARDRQRRAEPARPNAQPTAAVPQNNQPVSGPTSVATYDAEALGDALAEFTFDKEQRGEIRAAARRDGVSDVDAFVAKWARMFGKQPGQPATATPAASGAPAVSGAPPAIPAVPSATPVTSRGAPPVNGGPTDDTPIMSMSEADKRALAARIGEVKFAERHLAELSKRNVKIRHRLV